MTLPKYSIQVKPGREGFYAFFAKPWDGLQTSVKIVVAPGIAAKTESEAQRFASLSVLAYLEKNTQSVEQKMHTELKPLVMEFIKDECSALAKATVDAYRGDISRFIASVGSVAEDITWEQTRDYFGDIQRSGRQNKGHDNVLVNVRAFWNYLIDKQKLKLDNHPAAVKKLGNYGRRDVLWTHEEYRTYHAAAIPADRLMMDVYWNTGMYPADYFFIRRKHLIPFEGHYVLQKLREKANSPKAIINFPLKHCPAWPVFEAALAKTKSAEDRLFETEWSDSQYDTWNHTANQRGRRLWERLFPDRERKIYPDMRHTFATEAASGERFGKSIPPWQLDQWMGWVPGSPVGAKHYLSARAMPELMRQTGDTTGIPSPSLPVIASTHERLPFT